MARSPDELRHCRGFRGALFVPKAATTTPPLDLRRAARLDHRGRGDGGRGSARRERPGRTRGQPGARPVDGLPAPRLSRAVGARAAALHLPLPPGRLRPRRARPLRPAAAAPRSLPGRHRRWSGLPRGRGGRSVKRLQEWLHTRVPIDFDRVRDLTNEPIPGHLKRWWFALGGTAAYLFILQLVTGVLLLF